MVYTLTSLGSEKGILFDIVFQTTGALESFDASILSPNAK